MNINFDNGTILTMDKSREIAKSMTVSDGLISRVDAIHPSYETVDLKGRCVMPGFIDSHHHLFLTACERYGWTLTQNSASSISELLDELRTFDKLDRGESWLRVHGYNPLKLRERRSPTAIELDSVSTNRPIHLITSTYHESSVNSFGLDLLKLSQSNLERIVRNRKGNPTGVMIEDASFFAESISREEPVNFPEHWRKRAVRHAKALMESGITRIGDMAVPESSVELYKMIEKEVELSCHLYLTDSDRISKPLHPSVVQSTDLNNSKLFGVSVAGIKLLADGGERCSMCLSSKQMIASIGLTFKGFLHGGMKAFTIANRSGKAQKGSDGIFKLGIRVLNDASIYDIINQSHESGVQVAIHAVGNEAAHLAALAFSTSKRQSELAKRVEHVMIADQNILCKLVEADSVIVMQPGFLDTFGDELYLVPPPKPLSFMPTNTLRNLGGTISISSDFPASTYKPFSNIYSAIRRRKGDENEQVSIKEALMMYTANGALALGLKSKAGSIVEGAAADFIVLSKDPTKCKPEELLKIEVLETWISGNKVFSK